MPNVQARNPLGALHGDPAAVARAGRLAAPVIDWPLSIQRFEALCDCWRAAGVSLSLWNSHGVLIRQDPKAASGWQTLFEKGAQFRGALEAEVAGALAATRSSQPAVPETMAVTAPPTQTWVPDLMCLTIPVKRGRRVVGIVLAIGMNVADGGEALRRICDRDAFDWQFIRNGLASEPCVAAIPQETLRSMLTTAIDMARQADDARNEVQSLSGNLESTYEELNLIYRVSSHLRLPQRPVDLLASVGRELVDVSRSAAVAFVLPESTRGREVGEHASTELKDRIVQIGKAAPNLEVLDRLAKQLPLSETSASGHMLLNDITSKPEFAWAGPWLRHAIALPLASSDRKFGIQLAMNCRDEGDYSSIDVQLHRAVADRITAFLENQRLYDDLADLLMGLLHAMVSSIDAKDPYTSGHSERVAHLSRRLAEALGFTQVMCQRVYLAGLLHDVGKIGVPDAILCKPGKLTDDEFAILKRHPEIGGRILTRIRQLSDLMPGVLYHHERYDGRGYPMKRAGRDIPRLGRIICLADCFDAMTTNRTYRAAMPVDSAIAEIRRCAGSQFDPQMAEAFLGLGLHDAYTDAHANATKRPELSQIGALCLDDDQLLSPDWNGVL